MHLSMIGLGRMGGNMTRRLLEGGHTVVAYDVNPAGVQQAATSRATPAGSIDELINLLPSPPRIIWMMLPAGDTVDSTIAALIPKLNAGEIIIDGGNSYYKDSIRRATELSGIGIRFLDVGVSGGIWGLTEGFCLMAGGDEAAFKHVEPILETLAQEGGYAHVGTNGAGHFAKMVHNGIEYGMLQAYGEGFELLRASSFDFDLHQLSDLWLHGSVVRSWLLELADKAFADDPDLSSVSDYVEDSGEGRWTVHQAVDCGIPIPVTALALFARFRSREEESFSAKVIAALRREFGGHRVIGPE